MQSSEDGSRTVSWFDIAIPAASGARSQIAVERAGRDLPLRLLRACWIRASYDRIDSTFQPAVLSVQRSKLAALSAVRAEICPMADRYNYPCYAIWSVSAIPTYSFY